MPNNTAANAGQKLQRCRTVKSGLVIGAAVSLLAALPASAQGDRWERGNDRFDSVSMFGARTGLQLTQADRGLIVDDPGIGGGFSLNKKLVDSYFFALDFEASELDNTTFNGTPFEINRLRAGFGAHSREDRRLMGFWRFEYQAIQYFPTPPNGARDTEDGYGAHGGLVFKAFPWLDLWGSAGFMGLDEMSGGEFSLGASVPVTRQISLEASTRYTYLEDNDNDEFELFSTRGALTYRFGGPSVARLILGDRIVRKPPAVERTQSPGIAPSEPAQPRAQDRRPAPAPVSTPAATAEPAPSAASSNNEPAQPAPAEQPAPVSDESGTEAQPASTDRQTRRGPRRRR